MRNIHDVINQVLAVVPQGADALHTKLIRLRYDSDYQPPESSVPWIRLAELLGEEIGEPTEDWQIKISDIVMNKQEAK